MKKFVLTILALAGLCFVASAFAGDTNQVENSVSSTNTAQNTSNTEFPNGRGFAVFVMLAFSAIFAYNVVSALKSGRVGSGSRVGQGNMIRRDQNPFGFALILVLLAGVSLYFLYEGVTWIFIK